MAAWENDHQAILDHAAGLGYSRHTGIPYPPVSSSDPGYKNQWISWADGFNAWKAAQIASGNPIWATDPGDGGGSGGGEGGDGGGGGGGGGGGTAPSTGPVFTPLDLSAPGQNDYWNYYPQSYMPTDPAYPTMGLLSQPYGNNVDTYQPWSQQYGSSGLIPDNLWNYNPPSLPGPGVSYFNANPAPIYIGGETVIDSTTGEERPMTEQEKIESGLYDGNPDGRSLSGFGHPDRSGAGEGDSDTGSTPGSEPGFKG